jgi:LysM repeat protein
MLRRSIEVLAGAALMVVVMLAVVPAAAQAQEGSAPASVVVRPGDTLWSISEAQLGPQATPQQIAGEAERIYALNQDQIGPDPNLIFAGQRLVLPSAVERQSPESGPARAVRAQEAAMPTAPSHPSQAANNGSDEAVEAAPAEANREPQQSADARPEAAPLPEPARATPVPAVRPLNPYGSSPSLAQSIASEARSSFSSIVAEAGGALSRGEYSGRKVLGSALLAASSVLAIILARYVAGELWGPRYARRRDLKHWVSGYASAKYDSSRDLLFWEGGQWKRGKSITLLPLRSYVAPRDELPESHTPVAYSANGKPSSDAFHKIARARRQHWIQRRKAKRPLHAHAQVVARGVRRGQIVRRAPTSRANRARTLRRTGDR